MNTGEIWLFNPKEKHDGLHFKIEARSPVKVLKVGAPYSYPGMKPGERCYPVDFEVIATGEKFYGFSSQWFGEKQEEIGEADF